jgi:hypothetical protein
MTRDNAAASSSPPVSVVVLSHDRAPLLARVLDALRAQDLGGAEIIVVDNASRDGSAELVRSRYPEARLIALAENAGIRARNLGFRSARGELVLSLDDDVEVLEPGCLRRLRERFAREPALGALTLKIREPHTGGDYTPTHWWHPRPREGFQDREFETDHINEAAVMFRAAALEKAGYYYERLFWGGEEWDLVLGIMDAGYTVRYFPEPVVHLAPRGDLSRRATPRHALLVRNRFWIALRRLPPHAAIAFIAPRLALWLARALRYGYTRAYLRGLFELACAAPAVWRDRRRISARTYARLRAIRRGDPASARARAQGDGKIQRQT